MLRSTATMPGSGAEQLLRSAGEDDATPTEYERWTGSIRMKFQITITFALLIATAARAADAPALKADHKQEVEQQLIKVEHTWNEAFKNREKEGLSSICSEDFLFTGEDGKVVDRKRFIVEATTRIKVTDYKVSEPIVRSYGDTGIVIGLWKGSVVVDEHNAEVAVRFTDTFVRRDNRWWAVASQMTRATEDGAAP